MIFINFYSQATRFNYRLNASLSVDNNYTLYIDFTLKCTNNAHKSNATHLYVSETYDAWIMPTEILQILRLEIERVNTSPTTFER